MMWYLMRENSFDRLCSLPAIEKLEFFDMLNSVMVDRPSNWSDCVKLSKNLFHRLFITNVNDANFVQQQMGSTVRRYPVKDVNNEHAQRFVLSSSMLYAKMFAIEDNLIRGLDEKQMFQLIKKTSYSTPVSNLPKNEVYKKPEKFTDLVSFPHSMTPNTISLQYPNELRDMTIQPIEPFDDDHYVNMFIESAIKFRMFNVNGDFGGFKTLSGLANKISTIEFKFPCFRWSHKFIDLL